MPALVEADDDGLYVVKLLGAGHGPQGAGRGAARRRAGAAPGPAGARPRARGAWTSRWRRRSRTARSRTSSSAPRAPTSGLDFLPGALAFAPAIGPAPEPELAAAVVWLDAFTTNVDRTARNPNLLVWHRRLHAHRPRVGALHPPHLDGPGRARPARPFVQVRGPRPAALRRVHRGGGRPPGATRRPRAPRAADRRHPGRLAAAEDGLPDADAIAGRTWTISLRDCRLATRSWRRLTVPESPDARSRSPFEYAIVRVVPRVERGEAFNAGIVLMCRPRRFLGARAELDETRARARWRPTATRRSCGEHLAAIEAIAAGDPDAGPDRRALRSGAVPLAGRSVVDDHRHVRGPHRVDRGPSGDPRAPVPDPRPPLSAGPTAASGKNARAPQSRSCTPECRSAAAPTAGPDQPEPSSSRTAEASLRPSGIDVVRRPRGRCRVETVRTCRPVRGRGHPIAIVVDRPERCNADVGRQRPVPLTASKRSAAAHHRVAPDGQGPAVW